MAPPQTPRLTQQELESYLWGAATILRGLIDAGDYKQFIFPLLFFKRLPEVVEVDLAAWTGGVGETLRARVWDDAQVKGVHFVIAQADGTLVEEGAGVPAEGLWWAYVTTVDHPGGAATMLVTAQDLPGHATSRSAGKSVM